MKSDVVVIGGGAAGMFAAGTAACRGADVILLEPNDMLGKKLRITGKGRCNVTNNCSEKDVIANIPGNGKFLYSALYGFGPADVMAFFESRGVPLKTERGNRVFPVSDSAADIVNALRGYLKSSGVRVKKARAAGIAGDGAVSGVKTASGEIIHCSGAILCTGGASYPLTGSTGDGYRMAEKLGHRIISPKPSLVPLETYGDECGRMQGLSLRNVRLTVLTSRGRTVYREQGELLFTHFGLSGPLVLSASAHMRDFENEKYRCEIDLKPALDEKKLDARILRDFEKFSNRDFRNALDELESRLMIPVLVEKSGIPPETKVHSVTKEQRRRLLELFKAFPIDIKGPRPIKEAIITAGGVDVKEINPSTMESKLFPGLYFAGEIIDTDAYTGGFNLQIAWSTAYAAATHINF